MGAGTLGDRGLLQDPGTGWERANSVAALVKPKIPRETIPVNEGEDGSLQVVRVL